MKAYYINLARRTDRRASMDAQLNRLGIDAERIEAVTPADLTPEQRARYCDRQKLRWSTLPELSCSLSHHAALRTFLATGESHALILEDDVILGPGLPGFLAKSMPDCDVLHVETFASPQHLSAQAQAEIGGYSLFDVHGWVWGAAAYVVNRQAAETLLADSDALAVPFDRVIFNRYRGPGAGLRTWQLDPALAIQENRLHGTAPISDIGQVTTIPNEKPFPNNLLHGMASWWETEIAMGVPKTLNQALGRTTRRVVPFAGD